MSRLRRRAAQRLVPRGEWERWCNSNIRRSQQDIQKIMKLASADDPEAAHEAEKAVNRADQAKSRSMVNSAKAEWASDMRPNTPPQQSYPPAPALRLVVASAKLDASTEYAPSMPPNTPPQQPPTSGLRLVPKVDATGQAALASAGLNSAMRRCTEQ